MGRASQAGTRGSSTTGSMPTARFTGPPTGERTMSDYITILRNDASRDGMPYLDEVADEIESLRAEVVAKDKHIEELTRWNFEDKADYLTRIEELEERWRLAQASMAMDKSRIEELERLKKSLTVDNPYCVIPKTKIDAAWESVSEPHSNGSRCACNCSRIAMEMLNLFACEECGGSGQGGADPEELTESCWPCEPCHGHGWKVVSDESFRDKIKEIYGQGGEMEKLSDVLKRMLVTLDAFDPGGDANYIGITIGVESVVTMACADALEHEGQEFQRKLAEGGKDA